MADIYWRECPLDPPHLGGRHSNEHVCLPCGNDYLVPVALGALLIEDREQAIERMLDDETAGNAATWLTMGVVQSAAEAAYVREMLRPRMAALLAAAEGKET